MPRDVTEYIPDSLYGTTISEDGPVDPTETARELLIANGGENIERFENAGHITAEWRWGEGILELEVPVSYIGASDLDKRELGDILLFMAPEPNVVRVEYRDPPE